MKLIVGLGNLGEKYANTRHNLGFRVVDELASRQSTTFSSKSNLSADVAEIQVDGDKALLAKPTTMMNDSGRSVAKLAAYYKLEPTNIWVVHDELDLDFGVLRIRESAGSAGHHGVASVLSAVGPHIIRWRIGIGHPKGQTDPAVYVLRDFSKAEQAELEGIVTRVADVIEQALEHGHEATTHQLL